MRYKLLLTFGMAYFIIANICAFAFDDFYYRFDANAYDEGKLTSEKWQAEGSVDILTENGENAAELGENSAMLIDCGGEIRSGRLVLKTVMTPCRNDGFVGIYMYNTSDRACFSLGFNKKSEIAVYDGEWKTLRGYRAGEEYSIECVLDTESRKYDVYVNSELCMTDGKFRNTPYIRKMRIYTENTKARVSDIKLYSGMVKKISVNGSAIIGGENISEDDTIAVDFREPMNEASLTADTISITGKSGEAVPYKGEYLSSENRYIIRDIKTGRGGSRLLLNIRGGKSGVRASDGGCITGSDFIISLAAANTDICAEYEVLSDEKGYRVRVRINNPSGDKEKQKLFLTKYRDGVLIECKILETEEEPFSETVKTSDYMEASEEEELRAFLFREGGIAPYSDVIVIK